MTRTYSLVIEGKDGRYSAYVPELPTILVAGKSIEAIKVSAAEAIQIWWEETQSATPPDALRSEVDVELPI